MIRPVDAAVRSRALALLPALTLLAAPARSAAADEGAAVGKLTSPAGSLLVGDKGKGWKALKAQGDVPAGSPLLALPGFRADVECLKGAVLVSLWGNLPQFYNSPILETAAEFRADKDADLDLTLTRGRLLLTKAKGTDPARVRVRFHNQSYVLVLTQPGTEAALELIGRWERGTPFKRKPRREDVPAAFLTLTVLKGHLDLRLGDEQYLMRAPAAFYWDNVTGLERRPRLEAKLPDWATGQADPEARAAQAAVQRLQRRLAEQPAEKVLAEAVHDSDAQVREAAVFALAATNNLPLLVDAMSDTRFPDVRLTANLAARHWIGQGAGQDLKLYNFLMEERKYTANQAEILLHLLHSFRDTELERPETYETLIEYLRHDQVPVRELARWHLYRWVIPGRGIPYDSAMPAAARQRAYEAWKKLIPDGQLPPRATPEGR